MKIISAFKFKALYSFWLFEKIIHRFAGVGGHSHGNPSHGHSHGGHHSHEEAETKTEFAIVRSEFTVFEGSLNSEAPAVVAHETATSKPNKKSKRCFDIKKIKTLGWIILLSDLIHNFADGLAVGASFSESVQMGITTSIAVICHEVPHELGNYAVLVKSGFTHFEALVFNFVSALPGFGAFFIGASIPSDSNLSVWILSVTAGMFLYIALVELLPFVCSGPKWRWKEFLLTNLGMWLGFTIMFLLVIFEDHIKI